MMKTVHGHEMDPGSRIGQLAGDLITPLILTYNEEPNIDRTLRSLNWAERIIVLDSGSTDATETIAKRYRNVEWHVRQFDSFRKQTEFGINETGITTDYILALDADMTVPQEFIREFEMYFHNGGYSGGIVPFKYYILSRPLVASMLKPQLRLFNRREVCVTQDGHGHKFSVKGSTYRFKSMLIHDDRKSLERWVESQLSYSAQEAKRLILGESSRLKDKLRIYGLMPPIAAFLGYIRAGGPFRGAAAARYAYERAIYECLLAARLLSIRSERDRSSSD